MSTQWPVHASLASNARVCSRRAPFFEDFNGGLVSPASSYEGHKRPGVFYDRPTRPRPQEASGKQSSRDTNARVETTTHADREDADRTSEIPRRVSALKPPLCHLERDDCRSNCCGKSRSRADEVPGRVFPPPGQQRRSSSIDSVRPRRANSSAVTEATTHAQTSPNRTARSRR